MPRFVPATLPPGPVADLFTYVQHVYLLAGQPSFRDLARDLGCSYTTANSAIRGPRLPRWALLEMIGQRLGADEVRLKELWTAARLAVDAAGESDKVSLAERVGAAHRRSLDLLALVRAIRVAPRFDPTQPVVVTEQTPAHRGKVNSVLFRPGSRTRATVGEDGMLRLWRSDDLMAPSLEITAHEGAIYGAAFNRSGDLIATAGSDHLVKLWSVEDGSAAGAPLRHERSVRDVAFGLKGDLLVSVSSDGTTRVWEPEVGTVVEEPFQRRHRPLLCAAVSADGKMVAVGGADGVVELWDSQSGQQPVRLIAHTDQVKALAFHPQGPRLASSGMDRAVVLWDTHAGEKIASRDGDHNGTVYSLSFSRDGALLASGSYDGSLRVLAVDDALMPATTILETGSSIRSVAFSPDGTSLAGATEDGLLMVCSSARPTIPGSELEEVQAGLEHLVDLTRL